MIFSYGSPARAEIDVAALTRNAVRLVASTTPGGAEVVLAADALGHGDQLVGRVARDAGIAVAAASIPSRKQELATMALLGLLPDEQYEPVMRVLAPVMGVKRVFPGEYVSYGSGFQASEPLRLAHIRLGYSGGLNIAATNRASLWLHGKRAPLIGRVAMNSLMVDATDIDFAIGDDAVVFGKAEHGEPTVFEWAERIGIPPAEATSMFGAHLKQVNV
jgi:alanine racemase